MVTLLEDVARDMEPRDLTNDNETESGGLSTSKQVNSKFVPPARGKMTSDHLNKKTTFSAGTAAATPTSSNMMAYSVPSTVASAQDHSLPRLHDELLSPGSRGPAGGGNGNGKGKMNKKTNPPPAAPAQQQREPPPQLSPSTSQTQMKRSVSGASPSKVLLGRQTSKESFVGSDFLLSEFEAPWPGIQPELTSHHVGARSPKYLLSDYKTKLEALLKEYYRGGDFQAFTESIFALKCDGFNDVLVAKIFRLGVDVVPSRAAAHPLSWQNLLKALLREQLISQTEMIRGLYGWVCTMSDLEKDCPRAGELLFGFFSDLYDVEGMGAGAGGESSTLGNVAGGTGGTGHQNANNDEYMHIGATSMVTPLAAKNIPMMGGAAKINAYKNKFDEVDVEFDGGNASKETSTGEHDEEYNNDLEAGGLHQQGKISAQTTQSTAPSSAADVTMTTTRTETSNSNVSSSGNNLNQVLPTIFYRLPEDILRSSGANGKNEAALKIADTMKDYKKVLHRVLRDFFRTKDFERVESALREEELLEEKECKSLLGHEFVKRALLMALDFSQADQQAVCVLLQKLTTKSEDATNTKTTLLKSEDLQHGIALALGRLDDVMIDVPNGQKLMVDMLTRLVRFQILPAGLLKKEQQLEYGAQMGVDVLTQVLHKTPEYSRQIWSGIDERSLFQEMDLAIEEHFDSYDCEEVQRILEELRLSKELKIKFLRKLILYAIEKRDVHTGLNLISYLHTSLGGNKLVEDAMESIRCDSDDLSVDMPDIVEATSYVVEQLYRYNLISQNYYRLDQQYMV